jgi:phosphohistidine phosphatase SixA
MNRRRNLVCLIAAVSLLPLCTPAQTQGDYLLKALRRGGYVIVMRHASSPAEPPSKQTAEPDNVNAERQLDENGRTSAAGMGNALRDLKIPIGEVLSSPTYRALETVRLAQFGAPRIVPELGDNGQSMQASTEAQTAWLQKRVTQFPAPGANTLLVTHLPDINRAFPQYSAGLADGEALIFGPNGNGGAALVARVKIDQWRTLQ